MSVTERVQALGQWQLTLTPDCPYDVRAGILPMSHIVILSQWIPGATLTDAQLLAAARYTGVVRQPGPQFTIGGSGLAWWLGDEDGKGAVWTTAQTGSGFTLTQWVDGIRPSSLVAGTITAPGSPTSLTTTAPRGWTRRATLESICNYFGVEWRIRPNFALDVATADNLYGADPTAIIARNVLARDLSLAGLRGQMSLTTDWKDWVTRVDVLGRGGWGSSGGASASVRDGQGNLVTWIRPVESPDVAPGTEATVAANLLNLWANPSQAVTLTADEYDVRGVVQVGAPLYVFDPDVGLVDTANQEYFAGETIRPVELRCFGMTWPVQQGMGVYCRTHDGSSASYLDLTPWVSWESGAATLEVGRSARASQLVGTPLQASPLRAEMAAAGWDTYTPNWTASVTNPTLGTGGVVQGRFRRDGTTLHVWIRAQAGTAGFAAGSGIYFLSLPTGMTGATVGERQVIGGFGRCAAGAGGFTWPMLQGHLASGATAFSMVYGDAGASATNNQPGVWANNDWIVLEGTVEVAG
jgi:hypothetical protein